MGSRGRRKDAADWMEGRCRVTEECGSDERSWAVARTRELGAEVMSEMDMSSTAMVMVMDMKIYKTRRLFFAALDSMQL